MEEIKEEQVFFNTFNPSSKHRFVTTLWKTPLIHIPVYIVKRTTWGEDRYGTTIHLGMYWPNVMNLTEIKQNHYSHIQTQLLDETGNVSASFSVAILTLEAFKIELNWEDDSNIELQFTLRSENRPTYTG